MSDVLLPGHEKYSDYSKRQEELKRQAIIELYRNSTPHFRKKIRQENPWLSKRIIRDYKHTLKSAQKSAAKGYVHKKKKPNTETLELTYYPKSRLIYSPLTRRYMPMLKVIHVLMDTKLPFKVTDYVSKQDITHLFAAKLLVFQLEAFLEAAPKDYLLTMSEKWQTSDTLAKSFTKLLTELKLNALAVGTNTASVSKQEAK